MHESVSLRSIRKMNLILIDTDKFKLSNEVGEMSSKSEKSIKKM